MCICMLHSTYMYTLSLTKSDWSNKGLTTVELSDTITKYSEGNSSMIFSLDDQYKTS